jgi:hypothetical protein
MSAPALEALAAAKASGVKIIRQGNALILEATPKLPPDVVALLKATKPDLLCILAGREAARDSLDAKPPPDCSAERWAKALHGLQSFVGNGWGDQAALLGWTTVELYRRPPLWSRIDLTGAALLVGGRRVIAVTEASILVETPSGSLLKFRRIGREHLA